MSITETSDSSIQIRPASLVMDPRWMGAARQTRYSFSRTLIRRAFREGWAIDVVSADLDPEGRGEVIYRVDTGSHEFHFVAFTTVVDESAHTDRVVADRWEVTAALAEGPLSDELLRSLRVEVPRQEQARLDHRTLILTRGNRSVRFFQYLVDSLAAGEQPDPDRVADAGYILRSTAFYSNGKFGMRSFDGFEPDHPLAAPYRAQMLCAWLFRELSYLMVEHCAAAKGGAKAVRFEHEWANYFGLGNATGLGLVPYAFKHPAIIEAWSLTRERALAAVRSTPGAAEAITDLEWWIARLTAHFASGTDEDCTPFMNGASLWPVAVEIGRRFQACKHEPRPFDELYRWAESEGPETAELVVSLLVELHDADDEVIDGGLLADEGVAVDPGTTVARLRSQIGQLKWLELLGLGDDHADSFWWLISDNTFEPRRAPRRGLDPNNRDIPVDVALRFWRLAQSLEGWPAETPIQQVLQAEPEHRFAVTRLTNHRPYGEPHDNACATSYLPLMVQRFQLANYGMDNFKPKSTDWLRVTLFQGAPRVAERTTDASTIAALDRWPWPPRPAGRVEASEGFSS